MKTFDLANSPFTGTNLIEASAGTGKTYTIAALYLRLIIEEQLSPHQILVVTFTRAATAEIKDRVRNKLLQLKSAFSTGSSTDIFIDTLVKKHDNPALAMRLIQDALFDFDKAAIFTIHGFCQRVLHENAFETRSLFDTELVTDLSVLTKEIADDFWRKHLYTMPPEFISYALQKISGPDFFLNLLAQKKAPEIKIIPNIGPPALKSLLAFRKIYKKLKNLWPVSRTAVIQLLKSPSLSGTIYGSLTTETKQVGVSNRDLKIIAMVEAMDRFVDTKLTGFPLFKNFENYTTARIRTATRKKQSPPSHEIFDICEVLYQKGLALESEMERYLLFLKSECFKFAETELAAKKKITNIQFFDDLLLMVKKALESKGGNILANAIRDKYKARDVPEGTDIYSFPKGTRAGIFFHDLFEHLDFLSKDPDHTNKLIKDKLRAHGFGIKWQAPISTMLQKVLAAPLTSDPAPLTLSSVKPQDRINEMEFYFPLNPITPQKLIKIFELHSDVDISADFPRRVEKLSFSLAKGFMKGYIDLIVHAGGRYYLVDWKSNFLGSRREDYDQAVLVQTMNKDFYILQYHLYTLALHQYLQMRVPGYRYERDFGGVIYIFIRGVEPDQGSDFGIYKDLPTPDIIRALGSTLIPNFSL